MKFGIDSDGNYGYIKVGADTVTPFNSIKKYKNTIINFNENDNVLCDLSSSFTIVPNINETRFNSSNVYFIANIEENMNKLAIKILGYTDESGNKTTTVKILNATTDELIATKTYTASGYNNKLAKTMEIDISSYNGLLKFLVINSSTGWSPSIQANGITISGYQTI